MNYLLVDDEKLQLLKLIESVKEAVSDGLIDSFDNPLSALEAAKKTTYDVAFLDIELPVMNGIELAKKLKEIDPEINIIFVTGYSEYALDAHKVHASGYLTKPVTVDAIKEELSDLRYPIPHDAKKKLLEVQCFGQFEVFKDHIPLSFDRSKTKELFAVLVYLKGAKTTTEEVSKLLFKDEKSAYVRNLIADLNRALKLVGADEVLIRKFNELAVDVNLLDCDYYDYVDNEMYAVKKYRGKFMAQYDWAKMKK